ncbi:hypothetical protein [Streptomyces sp. NPDC058268]|uniref:hypothetical protein n=1 Tax=Streptomyces sp. NPDC058268 TaxID=3346413 RepID=UPI0036E3AF8B
MSEPETIECQASRRGRTWVTHIREHGVYGHGRTLKATHDSTAQGLELVGVSAKVSIVPVTPELEELRAAEDAYETALGKAVSALALRRTTLRDIALATKVPTTRVRRLLAENEETPHPEYPDAPGQDAAGHR